MNKTLAIYTKNELIAMLKSTFKPLELYARLELTSVYGGKPFALESERHANHSMSTIRLVQKKAQERIVKTQLKKGKKSAKTTSKPKSDVTSRARKPARKRNISTPKKS